MGFWDQLKSSVTQIGQKLETEIARFRNKEFAEAAMAACALVTAADGTIDEAERRRTAEFIGRHPAMQAFPVAELQARYTDYCSKLTTDFDFAKIELMQLIGKLRSKPDQARAIVQVAIVIGGADGSFSEEERKVVREACQALGLNPAEFEL
jgi:tellurite resistance protein TerB